MRDLDETLSEDVIIEEYLRALEEVYLPELAEAEEKPYYNKHKWEDVSSELLGDPANNAFPLNTKGRCLAALRYLAKYYANPSSGGVTAGYSKEDFKRVHNKIVKVLEGKYGTEHDGCVICGEKKKEGASLKEKEQIPEEVAASSEEEVAEAAPIVEETPEVTPEEPTPEETPVAEAAGEEEPVEGEESMEGAFVEEIKTLKESLEVAQAENAELKAKLADYEMKDLVIARKAVLEEKGIEVGEEALASIAGLDEELFNLLVSLLPRSAVASVEDEKVEEAEAVESDEDIDDDIIVRTGDEVAAHAVSPTLNLEDKAEDNDLSSQYKKLHKKS